LGLVGINASEGVDCLINGGLLALELANYLGDHFNNMSDTRAIFKVLPNIERPSDVELQQKIDALSMFEWQAIRNAARGRRQLRPLHKLPETLRPLGLAA
jgi:hypothetical protein